MTDLVFDTADEFIFGTTYDIVGALLGYQVTYGEVPIYDRLFDTFYQRGCEAADVIESFFEYIYDGMDDLAINVAFEYTEALGISSDGALWDLVVDIVNKNLIHAEEERGITY